MKSDINDLCEAFLAALTNAGYAVKSIENYKQVSNRFKKFCAENGYDTYTVNIGQIFADNVFNEETGAFVGYRNVMYGRFVRLINSFYLQGTFDFSMVTKEKNLPKSIHLIEIYQDYMEHLKTQYSNIGTIGFFQNGMLHLLRYMEDGGILTLKDLAVSDVVNYICSWSQKHQRTENRSNHHVISSVFLSRFKTTSPYLHSRIAPRMSRKALSLTSSEKARSSITMLSPPTEMVFAA